MSYCTNCDGIDPARCINDHPICLFCGCPVDTELDMEFRKALPKAMPRTLRSRLAHGFQRDVDGRWMHTNSWQCIVAWQALHGPLSFPEGISD